MIIEIDDNKTVGDIQERFNIGKQHLKLERYQHPHHCYEAASNKIPFPPDKMIGDIRKNHPHGELKIYSTFCTGDVEQEFRKHFNLNVQIFVQNGNGWLETTGTDRLTLKDLNEAGRLSL